MTTLATRISILALIIVAAAAGAGCTLIRSSDEKPPEERFIVEAPIESVDIAILESFPPQYLVVVRSGLPNGCAEFDRIELEGREGNTINVRVTNSMPAGDPPCDLRYGIHDSSLNIGTDFVSGQTYTVDVNGTTKTFVAQ